MRKTAQHGMTLVELLVAMAIGILLIGVVISAYLAQSQVYKTANSQASIQNAENAIGALVAPVVRAAGFVGCSTLGSAMTNLVAGGPPPLGTQATLQAMVAGYDAANTAGDGSTLAIATDNPANDANPAHWSPPLDPTLVGNVLPGSDVVVVLGVVPGSQPVGVTAAAGNAMAVVDASAFSAGQILGVSDCGKSTIFQATAVNANVITHAAGASPMTNAAAVLPVAYAPGAQVVPLRQTAFFVANGQAGQSALVRATLAGNAWTFEQLVPGVESMQALYGVEVNGIISQYLPAGAITDWTAVASVRLAFLIEGLPGSGASGAASAPVLLGTTVTPPTDTRLRHVYEMTINLRNAAS